MTLPLFPATLAAWRAAHGMQPDQAPREVAPGSVVKLSIKAKDGARTADTLGADR